MRFLDDVVTINTYVPAVPELREAAWRVRRIGLGFMGLADVLYAVGARYGARDGLLWAGMIAEWIQYWAMQTSIKLAKERGPFPAITDSIYNPKWLQWYPVEHHAFREGDEAETTRPPVDWEMVKIGLTRHGIRNGAVTTVAPTGTIGTVAGVEGYGIEPVFALGYRRTVKGPDGSPTVLNYTSPLFKRAMEACKAPQEAVEESTRLGSCQTVEGVPEEIKRVFVTAADISVQGHIHTQACVQQYFSNSISKTINFPSTATVEDISDAFFLGHRLGCCGLTVYVTGSRDKVVLETNSKK